MTATKTIEKEIVICDLKNCLNCGNCIIACERRHKDISRHTRAASAIIGISLFPNLCMVCNDPKCIEVCNHGGVEKDENGHIVVTDNCIGCGLCMRACPYNAILLFSGQDRRRSFMDKLIDFFKPNGKGIRNNEKRKDDQIIDLKRVEKIIDGYKEGPGSLMQILDFIQDEYGYLPQEALQLVSIKLKIPLSQIFHTITFHRIFDIKPKKRHVINEPKQRSSHFLSVTENKEYYAKWEDTDFTLILNEDKCISCGLCVRACEEVSGACAIRFSRQVIYGDKKKPFLAFPEACTGCGECAKICPTKAITLDYKVDEIRTKHKKVVKCDGCAGYDNRACVVNCPTGALEVISLEEYLSKHKISYNIEIRELLRQSLDEKL